MKIFLTAGHDVRSNGKGTGAFGIEHPAHGGKKIDEAVEAVWMRDAITAHLNLHGLKVNNDRNQDGLSSVLTWLRSTAGQGDWCIEIHFNAGPATATGTECVVADNHVPAEAQMARGICRAINQASGIRVRERIKGRKGVVLERETPRGRLAYLHNPAVAYNIIVEVCFITSKSDVEKYFANRKAIAIAIAEHIIYNL
jgi:N-acetylmuramoyl-L-alanine amidase